MPRNGTPLRSELALGIILVMVAAVGVYSIVLDPLLRDDVAPDPGPGFFPLVLLALLGCGGLLQLITVTWRAASARRLLPDPEFQPRLMLVPSLLIGSLLTYAWALPRAGYLASTLAFGIVWLAISDRRAAGQTRSIHRWLLYGLEGLVIALALFVIFRYAIRIPLP